MSAIPADVLDYKKLHAAAIIRNVHAQLGHQQSLEFFEEAPISNELLENKKDQKNSGLIRFLDESIYINHLLENLIRAEGLSKKGIAPINILATRFFDQVIAVRQLAVMGLDIPGRQILRTALETSLVISRCNIDEGFQKEIMGCKSFGEAKNFWHKNLARGKNEIFLKEQQGLGKNIGYALEYSQTASMGDILSAASHPNAFAWAFNYWPDFFSDMNSALGLTQVRATNRLIVEIAAISLATSMYVCESMEFSEVAQVLNDLTPFHGKEANEIPKFVIKINALLFLMLAKFSNRMKDGFDPEVHF